MISADHPNSKTQDLPSVSVIILTFNGSKYIKPLLDSLVNQTYPQDRMEVLVVDNASCDETLRIIRQNHPAVKIVALDKNVGFAAGNNQALLHASHDLLLFLNQDTICHPGFVQSMVGIMETNKTLAACNPNILTPSAPDFGRLDANFTPESLYFCDLAPWGYGENRVLKGKSVVRTKLLSGCAFIIRRNTVQRLGYLFDDRLWMYAEDTDLSLRLHNLNCNIYVIRSAVLYHWHHSNLTLGKTRLLTAAGAIKNRVYVYYKNMTGLEFCLFFPFLFLGGIFKIFEFPLAATRKALYFVPFGIFSLACMLAALPDLPRYADPKRYSMRQRRIPNLALLKILFK